VGRSGGNSNNSGVLSFDRASKPADPFEGALI